MPKPLISCIIVNYQADEYVQRLQQLLSGDVQIEVIVIDNSDGSRGYGAGCNAGAVRAQGEYLVFMNPDLALTAKTIRRLVQNLVDQPRLGIVGPQLRGADGQIQITCSTIPTPWTASILYSWLGKLPLFSWQRQAYRLFGFNHCSSRVVPALNGSCLSMRRRDWEHLGGFDEKLFLYFEEFDLCWRLRQQNLLAYFDAGSVAIHYGQVSTNQESSSTDHFRRSRKYWLVKTYGLSGWLAATWLEIWEKK